MRHNGLCRLERHCDRVAIVTYCTPKSSWGRRQFVNKLGVCLVRCIFRYYKWGSISIRWMERECDWVKEKRSYFGILWMATRLLATTAHWLLWPMSRCSDRKCIQINLSYSHDLRAKRRICAPAAWADINMSFVLLLWLLLLFRASSVRDSMNSPQFSTSH